MLSRLFIQLEASGADGGRIRARGVLTGKQVLQCFLDVIFRATFLFV